MTAPFRAGLRGALAFTLPEALWLAGEGFDDLVVAYPTVDRARCASWPTGRPASVITVMADSQAHLDSSRAAAGRAERRCACPSTSTRAGGRWRAGADRRQALARCARPQQVAALAREIVARPQLELDGLMSYEAHIAGVGDRPPGQPR